VKIIFFRKFHANFFDHIFGHLPQFSNFFINFVLSRVPFFLLDFAVRVVLARIKIFLRDEAAVELCLGAPPWGLCHQIEERRSE